MSSLIPLSHASPMPSSGSAANAMSCLSWTSSTATPSESSSCPSLETTPGESPSPSSRDSLLLPAVIAPPPFFVTLNTHPMQTRHRSGIFKHKHILSWYTSVIEVEPTAYSQPSKLLHWRVAMAEEYNALSSNPTWDFMHAQSNW